MKRVQAPVTPRRISSAIEIFSRELVEDPDLQLLPVTPAPNSQANDCFAVVERQVRQCGGSICYGWQIWEWPGVMIEAEFHAVWKDPDGNLHDVTPKRISVQQILFLSDPVRQYDGYQVNNFRRALRSDSSIVAFIEACDAEFQIMNQGQRAYQSGAIYIKDDEARDIIKIRKQKVQAYSEICTTMPRPARNDPCHCGSGKKFKRCCQ